MREILMKVCCFLCFLSLCESASCFTQWENMSNTTGHQIDFGMKCLRVSSNSHCLQPMFRRFTHTETGVVFLEWLEGQICFASTQWHIFKDVYCLFKMFMVYEQKYLFVHICIIIFTTEMKCKNEHYKWFLILLYNDFSICYYCRPWKPIHIISIHDVSQITLHSSIAYKNKLFNSILILSIEFHVYFVKKKHLSQ